MCFQLFLLPPSGQKVNKFYSKVVFILNSTAALATSSFCQILIEDTSACVPPAPSHSAQGADSNHAVTVAAIS